jgi:hypothetical protein
MPCNEESVPWGYFRALSIAWIICSYSSTIVEFMVFILRPTHSASYAFMDNHVHLVVIPERENSLRRAVGEAHRLYTPRINLRTGKRVYFFLGRPFWCPLDDGYYYAALRYVECNPVRAGLVRDPWDYLWSGSRFHVGLVPTDPLIDVDALSPGPLTPEKRREVLRAKAAQVNVLRKKTLTGHPCGAKRLSIVARPAQAGIYIQPNQDLAIEV